MSRFLVYVSPAVGHTLPLVPGLLELQRRGHDVHVKTLPALVGTLRDAGLDASPVAAVGHRRPGHRLPRRRRRRPAALRPGRPDGAGQVRRPRPRPRPSPRTGPTCCSSTSTPTAPRSHAEASGLPWAMLLPSVVPMPGAGIPPYGPGLAPMRGPVGWLRDRVVWKVMERSSARPCCPGHEPAARARSACASRTAPRWSSSTHRRGHRADGRAAGVPPRPTCPTTSTSSARQPWDPPAARPAYLDEPGDPWVLVTCSTEYQGDEELARVAVEALRDEPVRVLLTLADAYDEADAPAGRQRARRAVRAARPGAARGGRRRVPRRHGHRRPRPPRPAYRPSWCRSGATNPRSPGGWSRPAPASR